MTDTKPELLLYVWEQFSPDYKDGLAFAVAETEEQAKEMIRVNLFGQEYVDKDPFCLKQAERLEWGPMQVFRIDQSVAFAVIGGE